MKHKIRNFLAASSLACLVAASAPQAKAQDIRDATQAPKSFEASFAWKSQQGFSGRIWRPYPVPVAQVNGSLDFNLPSLGKFGLEAFVWSCYDSKKHSFETDVGAKITKQVWEHLVLGLEANAFSIKKREEGPPVYVNYISARITITNKLGVNAAFDLRNLAKYEVSASYTVKVYKEKVDYKLKVYLRDSYYYGRCGDLVQTLGINSVFVKNLNGYINGKLMKAFENIAGETGKRPFIFLLEIGFRYQM